MRILLLTHYFEPEDGAPQRRWRALAERLIARGHEIDVICPPPHYPEGRMQRSHFHSARKWKSYTTEYGARVHRVSYLRHDGRIVLRSVDHLWVAFASVRMAHALVGMRRIRPDVIVATAPGLPTLLAGNLLSRTLKIPLVAEMRDAWPDLVSYTPGLTRQAGTAGRIKHIVHERVTALQRQASHIVTTTDNFASVLRARGMKHTTVIRNGTRVDRYASLPERLDHHQALRVLYMGTVGRSQGLDVLLRAAAIARDLGRPVELLIVGAGADAARLRRLNAELGDVARILPSVAAAEVYRHYVWADTCVVSLRDWEPFSWTVPSKLYELMAAGRHISGVVAGEAAELIVRTRSGDVVGPGDVEGLARLWWDLSADRSRLNIGPTARAWARANVDYDTLASRYQRLLHQVVTEADCRRRGESTALQTRAGRPRDTTD